MIFALRPLSRRFIPLKAKAMCLMRSLTMCPSSLRKLVGEKPFHGHEMAILATSLRAFCIPTLKVPRRSDVQLAELEEEV